MKILKSTKVVFNIINMIVDLEVEMRFGGDEIGGDSRFFRFSRLQK